MFKTVKQTVEHFMIGVKLARVNLKHPSQNFVYATWNKEHTVAFILVDGRIYCKGAEDVAPLEMFPIFGALDEFYLVSRDTLALNG